MAGWPVIAIGLSSILASWAYSAGPWPFGRHGFADPLFFLFFGTMSVIGTYFVQAAVVLGPQHWREALPLTAVAVSLPIGALITNILIIDDIRDRDFDVVKGKNTIAVRFGKSWSRAEFLCLLAFAYLTPFWLWLSLGFSAFVLLAADHAAARRAGRARDMDARSLRGAGADDPAHGHADGRLLALPGGGAGGGVRRCVPSP